MEKKCYSCHARIFLLQDKDGKWKPWNDDLATKPHKCNSNNEHVLLRETITRVSVIEKTIAEIQSILRGLA